MFYFDRVTENNLIEYDLYTYKKKYQVVFSEFNGTDYIFIGFDDKYYYEKNVKKNIKTIKNNLQLINYYDIPQNRNINRLIKIYENLDLSNDLLSFQNYICISLFVSLYKKENEKLVIVKDKNILDENIFQFNNYCLQLPKSSRDFILYRAEYRCETEDMINLIFHQNEIEYYAPFSTTYNLDFALNWIGSNILYVIIVPQNCNYMLIKNSSQFEITLQQGKLIIINKYKFHKHFVFFTNFIPKYF